MNARTPFVALGSLVLVALSAVAAEPVLEPTGPAIGNNRYRTAISPGGDVDDFCGRFRPGDVLTVAVAAQSGARGVPGTLFPTVQVLGPDGVARAAPVTVSANRLAAAVKAFTIDAAGPWVVRVAGADGTSGDYVVSFRVKSAPKAVVAGQTSGAGRPGARVHTFAAYAGMSLDVRVTWPRTGPPVVLDSLKDPQGADVLDAAGAPAVGRAVVKRNQISLRGVVLPPGAGTYSLGVRADAAAARYTLTYTLTAPKRPSGRKTVVVASAEPALSPVASPIVSVAGATVRFSGANFATNASPRVVFCTTESTDVVVRDGGTALDVRVPPRSGPCVVTVTVVNPDGQGCSRPLHFAYMPGPVVTDLVDAGTGAPVRATPSAGGRAVRIVGANFEAGQTVRIGGATIAAPVFSGDSEIAFDLPAFPQGERTITVSDSYGRGSAASFRLWYETPPQFGIVAYQPDVAPVGVATSILVRGTDFDLSDRALVDGSPVESLLIGLGVRRVDVPALEEGTHTISLVDVVGTVIDGPAFHAKGAPTIASVSVVGGDVLGTATIPRSGGSIVRVDGEGFLRSDVVTLGGAEVVSFVSRSATRVDFVAPPLAAGGASLSITDAAGQAVTRDAAVAYAGLADVSSSRVPAATSADDFAGARAALGDLDGDGLADDVVVVAPLGAASGSRGALTRVLLGGDDGTLEDVTDTALPAAFTDAAGVDAWAASCVAIGDVDGAGGLDLVIGGRVSGGDGDAGQVRIFLGDGSGAFALDENGQPASRALAEVQAFYSYYGYYSYFSGYYPVVGAAAQRGEPRALALGDLDGDGDSDLIVGNDASMAQPVLYDLSYVDLESDPPTMSTRVAAGWSQFFPGTRIYENRVSDGGGFVDVSADRLPGVGTSADADPLAGLHCRDLAFADVNGDGAPDLVLVWDDPRTVSASGLDALLTQGASADTARIATRILINDGTGRFTYDATADWMPSGTSVEQWQADRVLATDLDADGLNDLVLVTRGSLDAWTGTGTRNYRALRILRNTGNGFSDVSSTALPGVVQAAQDDFRADAVLVHDVDGDGVLDIVLSTNDALRTASGAVSPRTRVLFGQDVLSFRAGLGFSEAAVADSGEASDLLAIGDLAGSDGPVLLLVGGVRPDASPTDHPLLRAQEWDR